MWTNTKKTAIAVKQHVAPLQANEVANIRKRTAAFDVQQLEFREEFRKIEVLQSSCSTPYENIDEVTACRLVSALSIIQSFSHFLGIMIDVTRRC